LDFGESLIDKKATLHTRCPFPKLQNHSPAAFLVPHRGLKSAFLCSSRKRKRRSCVIFLANTGTHSWITNQGGSSSFYRKLDFQLKVSKNEIQSDIRLLKKIVSEPVDVSLKSNELMVIDEEVSGIWLLSNCGEMDEWVGGGSRGVSETSPGYQASRNKWL